VSTTSGLLQARISQEVTCMVSIMLPSQIFIIVCGTADGRLYRVDCVAQAHAAQNQALSVLPLQQAEVAYLYCTAFHKCASLLCAVKWQTVSQGGS